MKNQEKIKKLIKELEVFVGSKDFSNAHKIKIKLLEIDERMNFWQGEDQDATYYNDLLLKELQNWFKEYLYTLKKRVSPDDWDL